MSVKDYNNQEELPVKQAAQSAFDEGVEKIRATIVANGFSKEAADLLDFKLTRHTLSISLEDARSGAFHVFADGDPFYAINIKAPGSMMDIGNSTDPSKMTAQQQAGLLAFEIGLNLIGRVEQGIQAKYNIPSDERGGGVSFSMNPHFETTTRRDPSLYLDVLNDLVDLRLKMLAPQAQTPGAKSGKTPRP